MHSALVCQAEYNAMQFPRDTYAGKECIRYKREVFFCAIINDCKDTESARKHRTESRTTSIHSGVLVSQSASLYSRLSFL